MVQAELPLVYNRVHLIGKSPRYELPLEWKAVFVLLIIYSLAISTITYVRATAAPVGTAPVAEAAQVIANTTPDIAASAEVKMTATVPGWYDVEEIDNTNILIKTNMKVWVNGREFIRCDDCNQKKMDPSLLEY